MKAKIYFLVARFFRFFASLVLNKWNPRIIVITGSSGKSTALNYFYKVLKLNYSIKKTEHANSAIGIPLDILNIHLSSYSTFDWFNVFISLVPKTIWLLAFPRKESIYLVELDADRPGEMAFFAKFITPEIVYWVSSYATHTVNFSKKDPEELVAKEYAKIVFKIKKNGLLIANNDNVAMKPILKRVPAKTVLINQDAKINGFANWQISLNSTHFDLFLDKRNLSLDLPYLLPKNIGYTFVALLVLSKYFKINEVLVLNTLKEAQLNPGRYSLFNGLKESLILDSSYNSSLLATLDMLEMLFKLPGKRKIAVLGDMRELGVLSSSEHLKLAKALVSFHFEQVVLIGEETKKYVYPVLEKSGYSLENLHHFTNSYGAGLFIRETLLCSQDTLLIKGSQNTLLLELIVEMLLLNKSDLPFLCRREKLWENKREKIKHDFFNKLN